MYRLTMPEKLLDSRIMKRGCPQMGTATTYRY